MAAKFQFDPFLKQSCMNKADNVKRSLKVDSRPFGGIKKEVGRW